VGDKELGTAKLTAEDEEEEEDEEWKWRVGESDLMKPKGGRSARPLD
jgi:hypothetical protein